MPSAAKSLQHQTLPNGMRLLMQPLPSSPSVAVVVMIKVGSRYESAGQSGIAHFIEHLLFKGTEKRPTSLEIASTIDRIGGEFNAFTSKEYTGFYIKAAASELPLCIDVLADIISHPLLAEAEIERERGVILEEMHLYEDTPSERVGEMYEQLIFPNQPLGRDIIGTPETLTKITRQDLRQFLDSWYAPNNMLVGIAGQFDPQTAEQLITESFGPATAHTVGNVVPAHVNQNQPALIVQPKDTDQTHLVIGVHSYAATDNHRHALHVLDIVLGGNMSSRLFVEVREKRGLAYAIHTATEEYQDTGTFTAHAGLEHQRVEEALQVILDQFRHTARQPLTDEELHHAQSFFRGRLALALEDPLGHIIFHLRQELLLGHTEDPETLVDHINAVTVDQVQQAAKDIFQSQHLNLAVIGPGHDEQKLQNLLEV